MSPVALVVSLLTGQDNTSDYSYLGMIDMLPGSVTNSTFRLTAKSGLAADSKPVRAFAFFWRYVGSVQMPPQMIVQHSGNCGRWAAADCAIVNYVWNWP